MLITLTSLVMYIRAADLTLALAAVRNIGPRFLLLLGITLCAYVLGTMSWQYCLGSSAKTLSLFRLFIIRHTGETFGVFNPVSVVGGDWLKVQLLKQAGIAGAAAGSSVILSRAVMVISQLMLFTAVILLALRDKQLELPPGLDLKYLIVGVILIGVVAMVLYVVGKKSGNGQLRETFETMKIQFRLHKTLLLGSLLLATLHWIVGAMEFWLILHMLNINISMLQAMMVDMGVILFKSAGAFIPGQLGVEEYGNKVMLLIIGVPGAGIWITASILRRARQLFWVLFGLVIYIVFFKKTERIGWKYCL
nr:lysylphosphatidylglycerol synthase domain-containing protein [Pedobacter sp. SYSU D00382]